MRVNKRSSYAKRVNGRQSSARQIVPVATTARRRPFHGYADIFSAGSYGLEQTVQLRRHRLGGAMDAAMNDSLYVFSEFAGFDSVSDRCVGPVEVFRCASPDVEPDNRPLGHDVQRRPTGDQADV